MHYGLSHAVAAREVARQTDELVGVRSSVGLYLNYLFSLLWWVECSWWLLRPQSYRTRSHTVTAAVHGFFLFMIVNGAVVFVAWPRRLFGLALVLACIAAIGRRVTTSGRAVRARAAQ